MSMGGDAADQVVKFAFDGTEHALRIVGVGVKEVFLILAAILKNRQLHGKVDVNSLKKMGDLSFFSVKKDELPAFVREAKRYGLTYHVVKHKDSDAVDIMVPTSDAPNANRAVEWARTAGMKERERQPDRDEVTPAPDTPQAPVAEGQEVPGRGVQTVSERDQLVADLFAAPLQKEPQTQQNPTMARTEQSNPSGPFSPAPDNSEAGTMGDRRSVRAELSEIAGQKKQKRPAQAILETARSTAAVGGTQHTQPQPGRKQKSRKRQR